MAKKKQKLLVEELLEKALVQESEWPYQVPENWTWTKLGEVAIYKKGPFGSSIIKAMFVPKGEDTYKVYEQGNAIRKDKNYGRYYISKDKFRELQGFKVEPGDLIVSCAGTIGETYQLPYDIEPGIINQALMKVKVKENVILKFYLLYFDQILREDITGKSKGTAIKNIPPFSILKNIPFPLPPLAEQQRIVGRIESLFEKLDQSKDIIQNALDSFENRKAAFFHKAFSGEFTKKWREDNNTGMNSWGDYSLGDWVEFSKKKYDPFRDVTAMPYIGLEHIGKNRGIIGIGNSEDIRSLKTVFHTGDILYGKLRPYLNKHDIVTFNGICSTDILVMRTDKLPTTRYINYLLNTSSFLDYSIENSQGINLPRVSEKIIAKYEFQMPPISEQAEIVSILDDIMEKEIDAYQLYNKIDNIDSIKKSILARAFRGKLGTNDQEEKSAIELLKRVLSESVGVSK